MNGEELGRLFDAVREARDAPRFVHQHCKNDHHRVCMGFYGGRRCRCDCHRG